jgi:hypothetical protein
MTQQGQPTGGPASGPAVLLGGSTSAAWREEALTRALELEGLAGWIAQQQGVDAAGQQLAARVSDHLARSTDENPGGRGLLKPWRRFKRGVRGASVERTLGSLDAVEADLLRIAPDDYVRGLIPSITAHVNRYLPKDDPRRMRLDTLAESLAGQAALGAAERGAAVAAYHAANSQRRRELLRLGTFRNVLLIAAALLLAVAVGLGVLGSLRPHLIPLCFTPDNEKVVCPTEESAYPGATANTNTNTGTSGSAADVDDVDDAIEETVSPWDLWLVEIIGLVAAGVAAAFALRGIRGTSTPYSLPVALALLKLATGALTAFLGLLLMRGGFVPGLSALDTSAQILSWAVVFGYAQQLFTRFIDQQASTVLESVRGRGAAGDRQISQRAA